MRTVFRVVLILLFSTIFQKPVFGQYWLTKMSDIIYSPRYFGPNGFPVPELRSGRLSSRIEVELRGEYHYYSGDKTQDLFGRVYVPFAKGLAALEVSYYIKEKYKMTPETRDERYAADVKSPIKYNGDVIVSGLFQLLKKDEWVDMIVSMNMKTASGGRLVDARFTDAVTYWFDATIGKELWRNPEETASIRISALIGFYCWMTNDLLHRQNDALAYGFGATAKYRNFTLATDYSGFRGYEDNGDKPAMLRNVLSYEYRKNIISLRYHHGMKDRLYDTYGLAYTRCF